MNTHPTTIIKKSFESFCSFFSLYAKIFFILLAAKSILFYTLYFFDCFNHIITLSPNNNSTSSIIASYSLWRTPLTSYIFYLLFYQAILIVNSRIHVSQNILTLVKRSFSKILTFRFFITIITLMFSAILIFLMVLTPILLLLQQPSLIGVYPGMPFIQVPLYGKIVILSCLLLIGIAIISATIMLLRLYLVPYLLIETTLSPVSLIKESFAKTKGHVFFIVKTIGLWTIIYIPIGILMLMFPAVLLLISQDLWMIIAQLSIIGQTTQEVFVSGFSTLIMAYISKAIMSQKTIHEEITSDKQ